MIIVRPHHRINSARTRPRVGPLSSAPEGIVGKYEVQRRSKLPALTSRAEGGLAPSKISEHSATPPSNFHILTTLIITCFSTLLKKASTTLVAGGVAQPAYRSHARSQVAWLRPQRRYGGMLSGMPFPCIAASSHLYFLLRSHCLAPYKSLPLTDHELELPLRSHIATACLQRTSF